MMMNRQIWASVAILIAFVIGGLLQRALFQPPPVKLAMAKAADAWELPAGGAWAGGSEGFWSSARPLGAAPPPPPPPPVIPPPPPPPAVPAGVIVGAGGQYEAIFLDPAMGEVHLGAGDAMPNGGRLLRITRNSVEWVDGKGQRFRHAMLLDPAPSLTYAQGYAPALPLPPAKPRP